MSANPRRREMQLKDNALAVLGQARVEKLETIPPPCDVTLQVAYKGANGAPAPASKGKFWVMQYRPATYTISEGKRNGQKDDARDPHPSFTDEDGRPVTPGSEMTGRLIWDDINDSVSLRTLMYRFPLGKGMPANPPDSRAACSSDAPGTVAERWDGKSGKMKRVQCQPDACPYHQDRHCRPVTTIVMEIDNPKDVERPLIARLQTRSPRSFANIYAFVTSTLARFQRDGLPPIMRGLPVRLRTWMKYDSPKTKNPDDKGTISPLIDMVMDGDPRATLLAEAKRQADFREAMHTQWKRIKASDPGEFPDADEYALSGPGERRRIAAPLSVSKQPRCLDVGPSTDDDIPPIIDADDAEAEALATMKAEEEHVAPIPIVPEGVAVAPSGEPICPNCANLAEAYHEIPGCWRCLPPSGCGWVLTPSGTWRAPKGG